MARALRYASKKLHRVISRLTSAAELIGEIRDGDNITGLTAGQFSAIDIMEHMVAELGPADVCVSTWTTGIYDVGRSRALKDNGAIRSVRLLLDAATFKKSPEFAGPLIEALGISAFRCLSVHAKVTIVEGERGSAVMRSSMNLNKNLRTEQFDIAVGGEVVEFYKEWFDGLWDEAGKTVDSAAIVAEIYDRYERNRGRPAETRWPTMKKLAGKIRGTT